MLQFQSENTVRIHEGHSTFTELNSLANLNKLAPKHFGGVAQDIFSAHYYADNPFTTLTSKMGAEKILDGNEMEWTYMLKTARTRPNLVRRVGAPVTTPQGTYGALVEVPLQKNWYLPGDVIHPSNDKYPVRIKSVRPSAGGAIFVGEFVTNDQRSGIPARYFAENVSWRKLNSTYEEGAEESGSTIYSGETEFRSGMTRLRKKYKVTGDVHFRKLAIRTRNPQTNKQGETWIPYAEKEFWEQFYREVERTKVFNRSSKQLSGSTGRRVYQGAGLHEKLELAPQYRFNKFSVELLQQAALDINYGRTKPGEGAEIIVFTGELGMTQISDGIGDHARRSGFTLDMAPFLVSKSNSPYHTNTLTYGGQFLSLNAPNGRKIRVVHMPAYDDPDVSGINPETGRTWMSNRMTILEISGGMNSNICSVRRSRGLTIGYVSGMVSPYGKASKTEGAHAGDYYEVNLQDDIGTHVGDTSRCVVLEQYQ